MLETRAYELAEAETRDSRWGYSPSHLIGRLSSKYRSFLKRIRASDNGTDIMTELYVNEFYRIEKQLRLLAAAHAHAKKERLPMCCGTDSPRALMLCRELVMLTDAAIDVNSLGVFFEAYQKAQTLRLKEVELIETMLRIALLECIDAATNSSSDSAERAAGLQRALISLDRIGDADMEAAIKAINSVDRLLTEDRVYRTMDETTRHRYLSETAGLAEKCGRTEIEIAQKALELAARQSGVKGHVGYYLIDDGRFQLIKSLDKRTRVFSVGNDVKLSLMIIAETALLIAALIPAFMESTVSGLLLIVPLALTAHSVTVNILLRIIKPKPLPRIIPSSEQLSDNKTLVCVPVLIVNESSLSDAIDTLEMHYLASRRDCRCGVEFCVLGDFKDSEAKVESGEAELLRKARRLIGGLNRKYGVDVFHYLHRKRSFAEADGIYMGHERKRGAVNALLELIKNGKRKQFCCVHPEFKSDFRYLVVLDADTVMPAGALLKLIGTMLHPLNRAEFADGEKSPKRGYSIIAPRMASTARSASASRFAELISGEPGMSPYNNAVSDFYQDVFGEGCFGGKGIIDIDAFMAASEGMIPDNTVLSHDMLEGCLTRAGFADDIMLYDGEPSTFLAWWKRRHRWLRGDFQLLPYLFGKLGHGLSPLSKYKTALNMLSGLGSIAQFAAIFAGCVFGLPMLTGFALLAFFIDPIIGFISAFVTAFTVHPVWRQLVLLIRRRVLELITLPYAFARDLDAVLRSLFRVLFSHRHMLEWQTAAASSVKCRNPGDYYKKMWITPLFGLLLIAAFIFRSLGLLPSLYLSAVWGAALLSAPAIVSSLDKKRREYVFTAEERRFLTDCARLTWRFFETTCTAETHYLPPDNYQEEPYKGSAPLTSPTNIGMALLAAVSAKDLKIISVSQMIEFIGRITSSLERMEKWRGQLFNWYDIGSLAGIKPRFVSSVDSGNLYASLITAAEAVREENEIELAERIGSLADAMDFSPLYDESRKLFHIGLNFEEGKLTPAHYDLLASESRLMSFALIAGGKLDAEHWFRLSRLMCEPMGARTLKSWSGTMFEYLMPLILMETVPNSLQFEICRNAVLVEQLTCRGNRPWGVSESGYYAFDKNLLYQYKAFGNPYLGLEFCRSLPSVTAPYASMLALQIEPAAAAKNLMELEKMGAVGEFGFYEAVDFDKNRIGDAEYKLVQSFMAHHQGMSLCALDNALAGNALSKRFMRLAGVRANEQLLFENMPMDPIKLVTYESCIGKESVKNVRRSYAVSTHGAMLSNGSYSVYIDENGRGFSKLDRFMLTRFDRTLRAENGIEFYVKNGDTVFSCAGELTADAGIACLSSRHGAIKTELKVMVSAERNCEIRRLKLVNCGKTEYRVEVGIFAETAMEQRSSYDAHPAFARLCTDCSFEDGSVLFRCIEKPDRPEKYGYFNVVSPGGTEFCCDGKLSPGRLTTREDSMFRPLAGHCVSEPIEPYFTARTKLVLKSGDAQEVILICGISSGRKAALDAVKQQRLHLYNAQELCSLYSGESLRALNMDSAMFAAAQNIAHAIMNGSVYGNGDVRSELFGIGNLWKYGISGDNRIVLLSVTEDEEPGSIRRASGIFKWLKDAGLDFDLIIIGEYPNEYANRLKRSIEDSVTDLECTLLNAYDLSKAERDFLRCASALCFDGCAEVIEFCCGEDRNNALTKTFGIAALPDMASKPCRTEELLFFNGHGGFNKAGEYVVRISMGNNTPLPWSNVIASESIGTLVTESGGGYTFAENARLGRITPWSNDAVSDASGERIFVLSDGKKLEIKRAEGRTVIHGFGYSSYKVQSDELSFCLTETVDGSRPIKYYCLSIDNPGSERKIDILLSFDFQIGPDWRMDGKLTKRHQWGISIQNIFDGSDDSGKAAFLALRSGGELTDCSRNEIMVCADIKNGKSELIFLLGIDYPCMLDTLIDEADYYAALRWHSEFTKEKLEVITVKTDCPEFDIIVNRRLLYQVYASRLIGRTGFYQSGGAFGFRDQLQDVLALLITDPERSRSHIMKCASMQFEHGDVLHWWHEVAGRDGTQIMGVRTTISDDRLFLPYAAAEYVSTTGDYSLLDEKVSFLAEVELPKGKRDIYCTMKHSDVVMSVYEHCLKAIECCFRFGQNGLPLMGGGDWNDGMDRVGDGGESVLLAFMLMVCIEAFIPICERRGDEAHAALYREKLEELRKGVETHAWNGLSYARAFYGDGECLGGREFVDCACACFSVFADAKHKEEAFDTMIERLVDKDTGLIRLISKSFSEKDGEHEVGYIRGYLPGVRENGGQYTHAAAWSVIAACLLNRGDTADALFRLINPVEHGKPERIAAYRGEPYAAAGDVYSAQRVCGHAGWTWYTGAAAWLYRAATEYILGLKKQGNVLMVKPCTAMQGFSVEYRFGKTLYRITAKRSENYCLSENGRSAEKILLCDDGKQHDIEVFYI